jgi:hypothetical protein
MLSADWVGALEESTCYTCWDLVYNPRRWRTWDFLGQEYEQALQVRGPPVAAESMRMNDVYTCGVLASRHHRGSCWVGWSCQAHC